MCDDAPELFEFREKVFNQVTIFIEVFVVFSLLCAVGFRRDHDVHARLFEKTKNALISVERFVSKQGFDLFKNAR